MLELILFLLPFLAEIESGNDPNAVGDNGRAIGIYQIHESYWKDSCEYLDISWDYKDAQDPLRASIIVMGYLSRYGRYYRLRTDTEPSLKVLARMHNGGPDGWRDDGSKKSQKTLEYWLKVEQAIIDSRAD